MQKSDNKSSPILVTGATGYIASHLIKILLERDFQVRGTIRSLANKSKYQFLYDLVPSKIHNLTLVEADLVDKASWSAAVEGCQFIFHVASPLPPTFASVDENELIKPAVEGTLNVLEAAVAKGAKKVVVTSSSTTVFIGHANRVTTEEDWSIEAYCDSYSKSKLKAEQAAWKFYEEHKDQIQVTVINPVLIMGPVLAKQNGASEALGREILNGGFPGAIDVGLSVVDVRDTAECHYQAMFNDKVNGQRVLCSADTKPLGEIIGYMKKEFGKYGYDIKDQPISAEDVLKSGHELSRDYAPLSGMRLIASNKRSVEDLGMKYRSVEETVVDMGYSMIEHGVVDDKIKSK